MRPKANEVLVGLKTHAVGQQRSLRSNELAKKLGLPNKIVSNALNWLVLDAKDSRVKREKALTSYWYKYWWNG